MLSCLSGPIAGGIEAEGRSLRYVVTVSGPARVPGSLNRGTARLQDFACSADQPFLNRWQVVWQPGLLAASKRYRFVLYENKIFGQTLAITSRGLIVGFDELSPGKSSDSLVASCRGWYIKLKILSSCCFGFAAKFG